MTTKITTEQENEIIDLYYKNIQLNDIYNKYSISRKKLINILKRKGLKKRIRQAYYLQRCENNKEKIINLYVNKNISVRNISKQLKISDKLIANILINNKVKKYLSEDFYRKYQVNENYFSIIDTPDKAYFLGWMFSDGCISSKLGFFHLTIHSRDIKLQELFKSYIKSEHPITKRKDAECNVFRVCSHKMVNDLYKLGCVDRKSLILNFPTFEQVPRYLMCHFIRGYFEGDGCINTSINKYDKYLNFRLSIMSSILFIDKLVHFLENELNISFKYRIVCKSAELHSGHKTKMFKFLDWIYNDMRDLYLDRKYNKYLTMKENLIKNPVNPNKIKRFA